MTQRRDPAEKAQRGRRAVMTAPACAAECGAYVRDQYAERGIEVTVSHLPPIVESGYEHLNLECPHRVLWHAEPTSDQIAAWARGGVA